MMQLSSIFCFYLLLLFQGSPKDYLSNESSDFRQEICVKFYRNSFCDVKHVRDISNFEGLLADSLHSGPDDLDLFI